MRRWRFEASRRRPEEPPRPALRKGGAGSQWRELRALVRGPLKSYMRKNRRAARAPPGPQHINFWGCERATPARSAVMKGLPSPDGFGSFRGARRSTRARDQAWGPTERRGTAGVNNKARSAAASDGAFRGVRMGRRDVIESPLRAH